MLFDFNEVYVVNHIDKIICFILVVDACYSMDYRSLSIKNIFSLSIFFILY